MSIFNIRPDDIETFTVSTFPTRHYISSSNGVSGSVYVKARRSPVEKDFNDSKYTDNNSDDSSISINLDSIKKYAKNFSVTSNILNNQRFSAKLQRYLSDVNASSEARKNSVVLDVARFTPTVTLTSNTYKKLQVKDQLMNHYKVSNPSCNWAYTNYNCLNFYTASTVPTSSVLLYPNIDVNDAYFHEGYMSGTYSLSGAFSFDFYIKPRSIFTHKDSGFKAGTIFHLSSSYAVSLVSGSSKDENGNPAAYRILLQLSHSAGITPSTAVYGSYPNDLIFTSDDNCLSPNKWHHVVIRWGTNLVNDGTGSFNIDGVDKGTFVIPSATVDLRVFDTAAFANPDALCVGNFYEGNNTGVNSQAYFFANDPATRDGIEQMIDDVGGIDEPTHYAFNHPLNAEVHELCIKRYFMSDEDISLSSSVGMPTIDQRVSFYLPPFFTQHSPLRKFVGAYGGILQTPFFEIDGRTSDPFNVALAFGVAGHYINIENYLKDFANGTFPRVHHMTGTANPYTTEARAANEFLYDDPFVRRRNTFVLPCDNGEFVPSFELLENETKVSKYVDDFGNQDFSIVSLNNMVSTASLLFRAPFVGIEGLSGSNTFVDDMIGFTPENPGLQPGKAILNYQRTINSSISDQTYDDGYVRNTPLTIYNRTLDASSNQVTFFDISSIFYGMRIHPGSLTLKDASLSGSSGAVSVTLKDDGYGNIYRADCVTSASTWNSVGNIFYDEGVIVIKNPHLYFFGKDQFELTFRGEHNVHVMKIEAIAPRNQLNSSSNPNFKNVPASGFVADSDPNFVYITNANFHDRNLNVVAKTTFAQPIMKRHGDKFMLRVKFDFLWHKEEKEGKRENTNLVYTNRRSA